MERPIRVLVCDDHPITRFGLVTLLSNSRGIVVVGEASDAASALASCGDLRPDVVLLDFRLPELDAPGVLRALRARGANPAVLVLTGVGTADNARLVLSLGARGFHRKTAPHELLIAAVRTLANGGRSIDPEIATELASTQVTALSPRELEVLAIMASGATNKEIGSALGMAEATVRTHVSHVLDKLDASDRTEAVAIALRRGLIDH